MPFSPVTSLVILITSPPPFLSLRKVNRLSKNEVLVRVKKMAVKNAFLNAFSKIGLVLLSSDKVMPTFLDPAASEEINLTPEDLAEAFSREDIDTEYRLP